MNVICSVPNAIEEFETKNKTLGMELCKLNAKELEQIECEIVC